MTRDGQERNCENQYPKTEVEMTGGNIQRKACMGGCGG